MRIYDAISVLIDIASYIAKIDDDTSLLAGAGTVTYVTGHKKRISTTRTSSEETMSDRKATL